MKYILISLVALSLLSIWVFLGFDFIEFELSEISMLMDECENCIDSENWEEGHGYAMEANDRWESISPTLSVVCRLAEIEEISLCFSRVSECMFARNTENFKLTNAELLERLEQFTERERLVVENIF